MLRSILLLAVSISATFLLIPAKATEKSDAKVTITNDNPSKSKATTATTTTSIDKNRQAGIFNFPRLNKLPLPKVELPKEDDEESIEKAFKKKQPSVDHSLSENRSIMIKGQCEFSTGNKGRVEATACCKGRVFVALWSKCGFSDCSVLIVKMSKGGNILSQRQDYFPAAEEKEGKKRDWTATVIGFECEEGERLIVFILNPDSI